MTPEMLQLGLAWYVVFVFSLTLHEAAHAFTALRLGDETAYLGGQVTLNPMPHMQREPMGTILVPLISFAMMGWMMGWASAPYDPFWARRHPRRAALMAAAGPASNLLLVVVSFAFMKFGLVQGWFAEPADFDFTHIVAAAEEGGSLTGVALVLSITFSLNLVLFLFNLLPFPPLDGSTMILALLPESWARSYQDFMDQQLIALAGIVIAWRLFPIAFAPLYWLAILVLYL